MTSDFELLTGKLYRTSSFEDWTETALYKILS